MDILSDKRIAEVGDLGDLFDILPVPTVALLPDAPVFTIAQANAAFASLAKSSRSSFIDKGFFEVFGENCDFDATPLKPLVEKAIREKLPNNTCDEGIGTIVTESPGFGLQHLITSQTPLLDADGQIKGLICAFTDVTRVVATRQNESREAAIMARDKDFLEETQRIAMVGSWESDLETNSVIWSSTAREIYEVDPDFTPSFESVINFFKAADGKSFLESVEDAMKIGGTFDIEAQITTAKGNEKWIRVTGKAELADGICKRIFGAVQDITKRKLTEKSLDASRNQFQSLIQSINGIFWEADANTFEFSYVSHHVKDILGYSPEEWMSDVNFWENHIHQSDRNKAVSYCQYQTTHFNDHTFDYRMIRADGNIIWIKDVVSVIREEGRPPCLRGVMIDITETKQIEELEALEKSVLELKAKSETAINKVLITYLQGIESIFPNMHCSIHMIRENTLEYGIAPSLPESYLNTIANLPIGPFEGSCGTAAFTKERVIVNDIATDPLWENYSELALRYNLRACWSQPIMDSDDQVIATLAFYYNTEKFPNGNELMVISRCASILKIILENMQKSILLEESSLLMKQGQELAGFGNWQWDVVSNVVQWSDELYTIYGLSKNAFKATFEGYRELLHPDDVERVTNNILDTLKTGNDTVFEERIVRPDGEIRYLKSWGRVQLDDKGTPSKMVGACLDITESKRVQEQLAASEARLQSLADTQTNYVTRTDLNGNYTYYNNKYFQDFGWIFGGGELYGKSPMDTILPAHFHRVQEVIMNCIRYPNQIFQVELDKFAQNGGVRSTFWHFICRTDAEGNPFEMQCIGLDISDKKRTEDALKESNERHKYVNKATNDATYDWNIDSNHILWGEGFTRLFGFELKEEHVYPLETWKNHIHPADRDEVSESLAKALNDKSHNIWESSYRFKKISGEYAFVHENGYLLRDGAGRALRMIGVLRDVTRQKEEEQHLLLLESAVTNANDLIIIAIADQSDNGNPKIIYTNEAFTRLTGYKLEEVIGESTSILGGPDRMTNEMQKILSAIKHGNPIQLETILFQKNGGQFWLSLSLNPIEDEKGRITHWVSIGRDITEGKRYTAAIEHQNEKLRNIGWMQSHVVRAPLARLMGAADLIKNYDNSEEENREFLDHMLACAHELDGIIREISEKTQSDPWLFMK